jgi:hypothetical protein
MHTLIQPHRCRLSEHLRVYRLAQVSDGAVEPVKFGVEQGECVVVDEQVGIIVDIMLT